MSELLPCPFCGGTGKTLFETKKKYGCHDCDFAAPKKSWNTRADSWQPIETAPKDGTKVDLWMSWPALPSTMGMADEFRVFDCWKSDGHWVHYHDGEIKELNDRWISHWMPLPEPPKPE